MRRRVWNECSIDVREVSSPEVLAFFARERASEIEHLAACDLRVDRIPRDARAPLFSARLVVDRAGVRTCFDELNPDAFLAVRDAFAIAKSWIEERSVATSVQAP